MNTAPYLIELSLRLATGLAALPESCRSHHMAFMRSRINADGGFSGREGGSDLYYTGFGLRSLAILDALTEDICARVGAYLRLCRNQQTSIVDFFSFLYCCALVQIGGGPNVLDNSPPDWPQRVAQLLETFRTPDGGYGKSPGAASGSTYNTFLVALCYELLGDTLPEPERARAFLDSRRREDGGFVEIGPMRKSGTNPTAAAVATLQMLYPHEQTGDAARPDRPEVVRFLASVASPEGGYRANGRVPLADLLSTFTAIWTLDQVRAPIATGPVGSYVRSLELPDGGFRGGVWDSGTDVEYTFYGLGCLALLAPKLTTTQ